MLKRMSAKIELNRQFDPRYHYISPGRCSMVFGERTSGFMFDFKDWHRQFSEDRRILDCRQEQLDTDSYPEAVKITKSDVESLRRIVEFGVYTGGISGPEIHPVKFLSLVFEFDDGTTVDCSEMPAVKEYDFTGRKEAEKVVEEKGDLLEHGQVRIIVHQTNCFGTMGAGIAKAIAKKYPEVKNTDIKYSKVNGPKNIFGTILPVRCSDGKHVVNMYSQYRWGSGQRQTDYVMFEKCLGLLEEFCKEHPELPVGFPYGIGCGLAGGDWDVVKDMIRKFSAKVPNDVYVVRLPDTAGNQTVSFRNH